MGSDAARDLTLQAADGVAVRAVLWPGSGGPVVVVAPATSVRARYYARFAQHLQHHGCTVLTFDYRGIGASRPPSLRRFDASWFEWGAQDLEAVLRHGADAFPERDLMAVGHSIGGVLIGLAPSAAALRRVFTVGAQYAHWRDYAAGQRLRMLAQWHVLMPAVTALWGYFPGQALGIMEDTPRGVVWDWARSHARLERTARRNLGADALQQRYDGVRAQLLALSIADDPFGTVPAIERALAYFRQAQVRHLRLDHSAQGGEPIGHFAYFHSRYEQALWPLGAQWLLHGTIATIPGLAEIPRQTRVHAGNPQSP